MAIPQTDLELSKALLDLIPRIMRSIRVSMREFTGPQLTVPQFRALAYVALAPCSNKQLADWQGVSLPAMSRMVECLVKRKLLVRTVDRNDRRQVQLQLSKKGRDQFERLRHALQLELSARITTLDEQKKRTLADGLTVLGGLF